jgi:hypothetical protein
MPNESTEPQKLEPTSTEPDDVIKRLVEWIAEKGYMRGHKTGELLRDALTCINKMKRSPAKAKAPKGYVIDDKGEIIAGTWTHKNDGHGSFHWRFDATETSIDD